MSGRYPEFDILLFVTPDGTEAGLPTRAPGSPGLDLRGQPYLQDALQTGKTVTSRPVRVESTGRWIIPLLHPVRDDCGSLLGFVVAGLSRKAIQQHFKSADLPSGARVCLFDEQGIVLAHDGNPEMPPEGDLSELPRWERAPGEMGLIFDGEYLNGVPSILAVTRVGESPWRVTVAMPTETAFSSTQHRLHLNLALAAVSLAVSLLLAVILATKIARRVRSLAEDSRRIGEGDLGLRIEVQGRDEVADLAAQFNAMAGRLEEARDHLEQRVEEAVAAEKEARQQYQRLLGDIADGYAIVQDGRVVFANRQFSEMVGLEPEAALGLPFKNLVPVGEPRVAEEVGLATPQHTEVQRLEAVVRRPNGDSIWTETSIRAIEYRGEPAMAAIVRDVSERRRLERERLRLAREAAEAEALRELLHQKTLLVNVVSHELRTPLQAVLGFSEMLSSGSLDEDNSRICSMEVHQGALRLKRVVDEVAQFAEIQGATPNLEPEAVELVSLIRGCVEAVAAEEPRHRFQVDLPDDVQGLQALVLRGRFEVALGHLLSNAARFSRPDSLVTVSARLEGGGAVVSVKDEGVGISSQELDAVFQPFYRTESSHRGAVPGAGLGLAIARRMVELWGGKVTVESQVGVGTVFSLTVPLAAHESAWIEIPSVV